MLKDLARKYFIDGGLNCAETAFMAANEYYGLGLDGEDMKLVSAFGGGMGCEKTCGVLSGSMAIVGKLAVTEKAHATPDFGALCKKLYTAFEAALGSSQCAELKPVYRDPELRCLKVVELGLDVLEQFIGEEGLAEK